MLKKTEGVLFKEKPDWVVIFGDTNSSLAGALAAAKLNIPVAHVEAGLRSYNKNMPEEINRLIVDHVSSLLFCPTKTAVSNLRKEGFAQKKAQHVVNVGDIMFDSLLMCSEIAERKSNILQRHDLTVKDYYLATIHRSENTDDPSKLNNIISAFQKLSKDKLIVWPLHPRTQKILKGFQPPPYLKIVDPVSYFDMLILEKNAAKIFTDSGGVQKEAYWFGVPCVTLREETEWVETLNDRWNVLVGTDTAKIVGEGRKEFFWTKVLSQNGIYGDGRTADKVASLILKLT